MLVCLLKPLLIQFHRIIITIVHLKKYENKNLSFNIMKKFSSFTL